jgi:hypothetical protein
MWIVKWSHFDEIFASAVSDRRSEQRFKRSNFGQLRSLSKPDLKFNFVFLGVTTPSPYSSPTTSSAPAISSRGPHRRRPPLGDLLPWSSSCGESLPFLCLKWIHHHRTHSRVASPACPCRHRVAMGQALLPTLCSHRGPPAQLGLGPASFGPWWIERFILFQEISV